MTDTLQVALSVKYNVDSQSDASDVSTDDYFVLFEIRDQDW